MIKRCKIQSAVITLTYFYNPARRQTKYSLDGKKWYNHGDFCEMIAKHVNGLDPVKDASTAFDKGCDIPEFEASVKSDDGSLAEKGMLAGDTKEEQIADYMRRVVATEFWWVTIDGNKVVIYIMNAEKFEKFLHKFTTLRGDGKIRFLTTSELMKKWLTTNCR